MSVFYSDIRSKLKTGDLISWNVTKVTSFFTLVLYLYEKICKVESSHVGVVVKLGNRILVLEAEPPEVRLFPLSRTGDFSVIKLGLNKNEKHIDVLLRHIGTKYGMIDLIKGVLGYRTSTNHIYCSELTYLFYKEIGYLNTEEHDKAWSTPDSIINAIRKTSGQPLVFVKNDTEL